MDQRRLGSIAAVVAIAAALAAFFHPLFTGGVSALTGDNVTHSLPLGQETVRWLPGEPWRFWDPRIAFGFPEYAEGQGAWFHPWKLLVFAIFAGLTAHDLLYVTSFLLTGASGFFVARTLGIGAGTALAGALAITFSPVVLENLYNASYAHSTAWAAFGLLAFELWWASPTRRRLALFAASAALVLLAGYPPTAYALFLFLGVVLATRLALDRTRFAARVCGFAGALALGIGLAALQVLPMLELTSQSVRRESVEVLNAFPWLNFIGGLVFDPDPALYQGRYVFFTAPLATVLALVAVPFLPALRDRRAASYLAGVIVCAGVAAGPGCWIFDVLRRVLPGLERLRLLSPFLFVAIVPSGVLLAALLEAAGRASGRRVAIAAMAGAFVIVLAASLPARTMLAWYRNLDLALCATAVVALAALRRAGRTNALPLVWIAVLAVEIGVLRSGHRAWLPDKLLDEGRPLGAALGARLRREPDARAIHLSSPRDRPTFEGMMRQYWKSPDYAEFVRDGLREQAPLVNLLADLPFAETSGALPLAGHAELIDRMRDELRGRDPTPPGQRALDRWGVRWVVVAGDLAKLPRAPALESVWSDPRSDLELLENRSVLRRQQWRAEERRDAASLAAPSAWRRAIEALPWVAPEAETVIDLDAPSAGTLFVATPLYPGWTAVLDGKPVVPLPAADGFGMELPLRTGPTHCVLHFVPHAFHLGVLVSVASALAVAALARGRA